MAAPAFAVRRAAQAPGLLARIFAGTPAAGSGGIATSSRREAVGLKDERLDVGHGPAGKAARIVERHGGLDPFEQVVGGQAVPVAEELAARQRRGHIDAGQRFPMACGAVAR